MLPLHHEQLVEPERLELSTYTLPACRSSQLSYGPIEKPPLPPDGATNPRELQRRRETIRDPSALIPRFRIANKDAWDNHGISLAGVTVAG